MKYNPQKIEKKWQKYWEAKKVFKVKEEAKKPKYYALVEFPYPSGSGLHVGHPRSYTALDIVSRKKRMEGFNVLYPIGFDAFGLPTENFAIKTGRPPAEVTKENIKNFTRQLKMLGLGFDWSRAVNTTDPQYYKWTQWLFLQFFKHGLAYKKAMPINWCLDCKIGLANEEVVDGKCERCGGPVEKRNKEQWMLAITKYADKLLAGLKNVDYAPQIRTQQENWIGRSEGALVRFTVIPTEVEESLKYGKRDSSTPADKSVFAQNDKHEQVLEVFTTRPDTLFGATYMVLAPEHELLQNLKSQISNYQEVEKYIEKAKNKSDLERTEIQKEKTGVEIKGLKAINPVNNEALPIFVADYVLTGYGTGAIMAVPAHDERDYEFAKKYNLPIKIVIMPYGGSTTAGNTDMQSKQEEKNKILNDQAFIGDGYNINSEFLNGLKTFEAKEKIIAWLKEKGLGEKQVQYKLRDWIFSRQRYWGEPIPLVNCKKCGWVPIPEKELPLELPKVKKYEPTDTGESPLAAMTSWVKTKCPKCNGPAERETDTMPNWAGSSWYFLRYCDPKNTKEFASQEKLKYWLPIDWYNGGMEHVVLHLLYSRFWNIFLHDIGLVPVSEPYKKRTAQGMILAKGGEKMSKSKGNVVNPDEMVKQYGADALRTYIMFMGPFDQAVEWDTNGLVGVRRFLDRVWLLKEKVTDDKSVILSNSEGSLKQSSRDSSSANRRTQNDSRVLTLLHQTIKKVTEDIEAMQFNTAVSALMILGNALGELESIPQDYFEKFILLLSPFAPHLTEELWQVLGHKTSITKSAWPIYDTALVLDREITLVVQINGKVRENLTVPADINEKDATALALKSQNVQKWLEGKMPKKVVFVKGRLINLVV